MEGLTIGRIVHYVDLNEKEGTQGEYAAIISHIWHGDVVSLHVFNADGVSVVHQVGFSLKPVGHSWHWAESSSDSLVSLAKAMRLHASV